jgi:hypothetical protein
VTGTFSAWLPTVFPLLRIQPVTHQELLNAVDLVNVQLIGLAYVASLENMKFYTWCWP